MRISDRPLTARGVSADDASGTVGSMWGKLYAWFLRRYVPEQQPELSRLDLWDATGRPRDEVMAELLDEVKPRRERGSTAPWGIR